MTIWRAHRQALLYAIAEERLSVKCHYTGDTAGFYLHQNESSRRIVQSSTFANRLEAHLQEWDDDIEELNDLFWKEVSVRDFLGLTDDEMEEIDARITREHYDEQE